MPRNSRESIAGPVGGDGWNWGDNTDTLEGDYRFFRMTLECNERKYLEEQKRKQVEEQYSLTREKERLKQEEKEALAKEDDEKKLLNEDWNEFVSVAAHPQKISEIEMINGLTKLNMLLAGDDSARYIGMLVEQQSAFQLLRLYQHCVFRVRVFRSENSDVYQPVQEFHPDGRSILSVICCTTLMLMVSDARIAEQLLLDPEMYFSSMLSSIMCQSEVERYTQDAEGIFASAMISLRKKKGRPSGRQSAIAAAPTEFEKDKVPPTPRNSTLIK